PSVRKDSAQLCFLSRCATAHTAFARHFWWALALSLEIRVWFALGDMHFQWRVAHALLSFPFPVAGKLFPLGPASEWRRLFFQRRGHGDHWRFPAAGKSAVDNCYCGNRRFLPGGEVLAVAKSRSGRSGAFSGVRTSSARQTA